MQITKVLQRSLRVFPFKISNRLIHWVFGCLIHVHIHNQPRRKRDPWAIKCVILSYSSTQRGYKCYNALSIKFYFFVDVILTENTLFSFSKYQLREVSMMENGTCESFESLNILDLLHVLWAINYLSQRKSITFSSWDNLLFF